MASRFPVGRDRDVVLCGRVCLLRNLGGTPFPARMDAEERRDVLKEVHAAVFDRNLLQGEGFRFFVLDGLDETKAVSLVERGLADANFIAEREGRGLFVSRDESCSILVNGEDHVAIRAASCGFSLSEAFEKADLVETVLDKSLHFAFDPQLGYLTRNPAHLGTGMIVSFLLHLPALADSGAVARLSANLMRIGMSLQNLWEPAPETGGELYFLVNRMTMGLSERDAVENLGGIAQQVVSQERAARKEYLSDPASVRAVKDAARGLRTAERLTYEEFLGLVSLVRLGIAARLISGAGFDAVDRLILQVRPATLSMRCGGDPSPEKNAAARASAVRERLASLTAEGEG